MVVMQRQMLGRPGRVAPRRPIAAHLEVAERVDVVREETLRYRRIVHQRGLTRVGERDVAGVKVRMEDHLLTDSAAQIARRADRLPRYDPWNLVARAPVAEGGSRDGHRRRRLDPIETEVALKRVHPPAKAVLPRSIRQAAQAVQAHKFVNVPANRLAPDILKRPRTSRASRSSRRTCSRSVAARSAGRIATPARICRLSCVKIGPNARSKARVDKRDQSCVHPSL